MERLGREGQAKEAREELILAAQFLTRMPDWRVERLDWYPDAHRREQTHDLDLP